MKKIVLCGTPNFVVGFFEKFINSDEYIVKGVITRAPKVKNGKILDESSIAKWAKKKGLNVLEVANINKEDKVKDLLSQVDAVLVFAFGQIISTELLNLPKYGFFNIHPSKLPDLRGPSPLQTAIMRGDRESAITLMKMNEKMDEGDIIDQLPLIFNKNHNIQVIMQELSKKSASWVKKKLSNYFDTLISYKQENSKATYCNLITKNLHIISNESPIEILNKIKGLGFVIINHKELQFKCFLAKLASETDEFIVNGISPIYLQLPGKKIIHIRSFLNGYRGKL